MRSDGNSHAWNEPHNSACANGADCGHAAIIDKSKLLQLRSGVTLLARIATLHPPGCQCAGRLPCPAELARDWLSERSRDEARGKS